MRKLADVKYFMTSSDIAKDSSQNKVIKEF